MAVKRQTRSLAKGQVKRVARKSIQVCAHWKGLENPVLMGALYAAP